MSGKKSRGADRRKKDVGPLNRLPERRKKPERRMPQVEDVELSQEEFMKLFGVQTNIRNTDHQLELASEVFEKVRD